MNALKSHQILLEGVNNCRHYGGYKVGAGRIKPGKLIRGAALNGLTPEDHSRLEGFAVDKVIDLRTQAEVDARPNQSLGNAQLIHLDVMRDFVKEHNASPMDMLQMLKHKSAEQIMDGIYCAFVEQASCRAAYQRFFIELLGVQDGAMYFHCTAGKDRTGFGGALVLLALGADQDLIMEDYLLSNPCREQENQEALVTIMQSAPDQDEQEILTLLQVKADYLNASFKKMRDLYGSPQKFLTQGIGLSDQQQACLQALLVE